MGGTDDYVSEEKRFLTSCPRGVVGFCFINRHKRFYRRDTLTAAVAAVFSFVHELISRGASPGGRGCRGTHPRTRAQCAESEEIRASFLPRTRLGVRFLL